MASYSLSLLATSLLLLLLSSLTTTVVSVEDDELESMLNVLRARGYNLFSNAISTSDLIFEVLTGRSFTFFAPTDSALFTVDMTATALDYLSTLRCHVIPVRIPFPELRRLPSGSSLPTLFKDHSATIENPSSGATSDEDLTSVNGVRIVFPDLFYSSNIAIHGLRGIINCTSTPENQFSPPPTVSPPDRRSHRHHGGSRSRNRGHAAQPAPPPRSNSSCHGHGTAKDPELPSPPPVNLYDHIEPPSARDVLPPVGNGFSPSVSPAKANFPPQVSPAYDLWMGAPSYSDFASWNEPVSPPEFSENDDRIAFPPSATDRVENHGVHKVAAGMDLSSMNEKELRMIEEEMRKSELSNGVPEIQKVKLAGMMERVPAKSEPLDGNNFDCPII